MNESLYNPVWQVEFWIDGHKKYAMRHTTGNIPMIGDEVRFKNVVYKVVNRIWMYDDSIERVCLSIERLNKE